MEGLKSHGGFFEAGLRSLWSFTAGALGAQPQRQPVPAGGGALQQPPTAPASEILLGVAGLSPTSLSPRAWQRGLCRVPSFKGSKEQHGDLARAQPVPGWGPMMPTLPACPQGWLSPSPWSCLHIPPVSPSCLFQPAVTKQCPQLQQLRRAPGGPWGHVPLAGLLSSHLPPSAPDQACRCPPAASQDASRAGGETEARGEEEHSHTEGWQ